MCADGHSGEVSVNTSAFLNHCGPVKLDCWRKSVAMIKLAVPRRAFGAAVAAPLRKRATHKTEACRPVRESVVDGRHAAAEQALPRMSVAVATVTLEATQRSLDSFASAYTRAGSVNSSPRRN
jgi:hypothetical protein